MRVSGVISNFYLAVRCRLRWKVLNLGIQTISTVSTRIEYEDGVVYFDPEPSEMEQMEYVCLLSDDYENGGCYPYRFFDRLCKGAIAAPFHKERFLGDVDITATLEGFGLDTEKFWMAVLFVYDWAENQFVGCVDIKSHSHGLLLQDLLAKLGDDTSDVTIRIRKGRRNLEVSPMIRQDILDALHAKSEALKRKGIDRFYAYSSEDFKDSFPVSSYKMCFAAERFQELFAALERCGRMVTPKRRKGSIVSYNRMLLVSRIIYLFRYTDNSAFLDSDDPLKGILKDYRGKIPQTLSAIYD